MNVRARVVALCFALTMLGVGGCAASKVHEESDALARAEYASYVAHLAAADGCLALNDTAGMRKWLERAPAGYCGWEWNYLNAQADQSAGVLAAQDAGVFDVAFSRDGKMVCVADSSGVVMVRDARTGAEVSRFAGHKGPVYRAAFSPDGTLCATAGADRTSRVFDAATGVERTVFKDVKTPITAVAFLPDVGGGARVACTGYTPLKESPFVDGTVWVWNAATGAKEAEIRGAGNKPLSSIAVNADGSRAVVGSWSGVCYVADLSAAKVIAEIVIPESEHYTAVNHVAFSPDGRLIAAGSKDQTARLFDSATGELKATFPHGGWVTGVAFSPDGMMLATAAHDNLIRTWAVGKGDQKSSAATMRGHTGGPWTVAWSPDRATLVSSGTDGRVLNWDAGRRGDGVTRLRSTPGVYGAAFLGDAGQAVTCADNGEVTVWETAGWTAGRKWAAHAGKTAPCNTVSASTDGSRVVTCSWDKSVKLWDVAGGTMLRKETVQGAPKHAAISDDGKLFAVIDGKGVNVYAEGREGVAARLNAAGAPEAITFAPDGATVAAACRDGVVRVWNSGVSGDPIATYSAPSKQLLSVDFGAGGKVLAASDGEGNVTIWNARTQKRLWSAKVSDTEVYRVRFSPSGCRLAVGGSGVWVLDTGTGEVLLSERPLSSTAWDIAFSRDGSRMLVAGLGDSGIVVLEAPPPSTPSQKGRDR